MKSELDTYAELIRTWYICRVSKNLVHICRVNQNLVLTLMTSLETSGVVRVARRLIRSRH